MATLTLVHQPGAVLELERWLRAEITAANLDDRSVTSTDGNFKMIRVLGHGASSVVCKAHERKLDRPIALKLFPALADDALARAVKREAQGLARIAHPNIVTVYDFDVLRLAPGDRCCFFVAMELGVPLKDWLRDSAPSREKILTTFCSAGEGLAAIHTAGLVYRDFKPENMVVVAGVPKLVDFGLALAVATASEAAGTPPRVVGTPAFMAPEALRGHQDARSDQFSFAAALWKALCGELPYDGLSNDPRARGPQRVPKAALPEPVLHALRRALDPDPARRFPDMNELLAALRPAAEVVRGSTSSGRAPEVGRGSTSSGRAPEVGLEIHATTEITPAPRRRRSLAAWLAFPTAGLLSVGGTLAAMGFWADDSPPAETSDEDAPDTIEPTAALSPPAAPSCPEVEELAGSWRFTATAQWAEHARLLDKTGHYALELRSDGTPCGLRVDLRKLGNDTIRYAEPLVDTQPVRLTALAPFTGGFAGHFAPKRAGATEADNVYDFAFIVDGDRLLGDFHAQARADKLRFSGVVAGTRSRGPNDAESKADSGELQPCLAHCGARCLGPGATAECRQTCSKDAWAQAPCPAPDPTEAVVLPAKTENCARAVPLTGRWLFLARDRETREHRAYEVELRVDGCDLFVADARERGSGTSLKGQGRAHATGLWQLNLSNTQRVRHQWSLVGWDPAFGEFTARHGETRLAAGVIAAYRL